MKLLRTAPFIILFTLPLLNSCKNDGKKKELEIKEPKLKEETVSYKLDSSTRNNFVVYDENIKGKRPAILVIHEWWGLNEYAKMRARELAKLGYIAMAVDMYGDGKMGDDVSAADKLSAPFYATPEIAKPVFEAALNKLKTFSETDAANVAAIGYCFGGAQILNLAKMGGELKGVVSFHGNLTVVPANKDLLKAQVLVCHGGADPFVPQTEVDLFKKQMDSIGAKYTLKVYEGATHAFTNPDATMMGEKFKIPIRYNPTADSASWKDMKEFFHQIFH